MKNKHNTMNSKSAPKTYEKMQQTILSELNAKCLLVEVIAKESQNIPWQLKLKNAPKSDERIRKVSIDKFYELVTGKSDSFKRLCEELPFAIEDVLAKNPFSQKSNSVVQELKGIDSNLLKILFLNSFRKYMGFNNFNV
jgi:hypothetical protein